MCYGLNFSLLWTPPPLLSMNRSPSPSFEEDFGVSKDTLLHGSYADYIKEYSARSGRASGSGGQSSSHQPHQVYSTPRPSSTHTLALRLSLSDAGHVGQPCCSVPEGTQPVHDKAGTAGPLQSEPQSPPSTKLHPPLSLFSSLLFSQMPPMDPKTYSRLVEEFLSKTQGTKSSHR